MTRLWYSEEYAAAISENFLTLRTGMVNTAFAALAEAGMERTRIPDLDAPPDGMHQLDWEAVWFESLADDAALFVLKNPTPENVGAAATLSYLARVAAAVAAGGENLMPLIEASVFLAMAMSRHTKATGGVSPEVQAIADQLDRTTAGLKLGPSRKQELAELWRRPVRTFLKGLWATEPAMLQLDAKALWRLWLEREPMVVTRLQASREIRWPSDGTAHAAVRDMVREIRSAE